MHTFLKMQLGDLIEKKSVERGISMLRICNFLDREEKEISAMYKSPSIDSEALLRWSKLLEYDFFRLYTQHLILYSPPGNNECTTSSVLPQFRKNIYTKEIIDFILELIEIGKKTKAQVVEEYKIPKTTLYKWISKHRIQVG